MSVVPNAVYANPTTPCWEPDTSGGGLNPFVDTLTFNVPSGGILSERVALGENVFSGQSQVAIFNANANTLGPLQVGGVVEVQGGSALPTAGQERMLYQSSAITYQEATTGTSRIIVAKTAGPPPSTFALTNIASINGSPVFAPAYGSFSSTATQTPLALTATPLAYDTADIVPAGVSVTLPSSNITLAAAGTYKVVTSVQCDNTAVGAQTLDIWCDVNGTAVPNSATRVAINQNTETVMTVEWFLTVPAAAVLSVVVYAPVAGPQALAVPAAPPVPAIPSVITTVLRIA